MMERPHPRLAEIVKMRRSGCTLDQIGRTVGYSKEYVGRIIRRHGDPKTRPTLAVILALRAEGMTQAEIAVGFGVTPGRISQILGGKMNPPGE